MSMHVIANFFGRLICKYRGHLRGRLISKDQTHKTFGCPRCGRSTIYTIKAKA